MTHLSRGRAAALTAAALAAATVVATPSDASRVTPARPVSPAKHGTLQPQAHSFTVPTRGVTAGRHAYFVEFTGGGAADAASGARGRAAVRVALSRRGEVSRLAGRALDTAKQADRGAARLFVVSNAVPGLGVRLDPAGVRAMSGVAGVSKITRIVTKTASNSSVANLVRAVDTWSFAGNTGKGVTIGVIDTGLDYTHADFGGVGTAAAYDKAHADETAYNWRAGLPALGKAKVLGGYDFVGDSYNADPSSASYQPIPNPDSNPIDCEGHGTHVAGTAAGYGVGSAGKTFTGDYRKLNAKSLLAMDIGPGMAPQAKLYGLRVFGCEGSTDEIIPALDYSLDPNGDGDFRDHLDIVNLSLGGDFAPADDPDNAVIDKLARHGVLSVISSGNAGDLTDSGGSPGNATSSLTAASSVDSLQQRDGLKIDAPAGVAGIVAGQMSVAYDWPNNGPTHKPVSGTVVTLSGANADGCSPLSEADAAKVDGKVAWLEWDDNSATRRCGSVGRSGNVKAAGAIGAVFTSGLDVFGAGITGDAVIPVFQFPKAVTARLRPAATAGTLKVTFDGRLQATIKDVTYSITDTLSSFSSRGPHGSLGTVKPDVTAPGDTVSSANVGTGNQVLTISGTSMAAPATAGVAALVKAQHPKWSTLFVKAAVMNTARHDLYTKPGRRGHRYGPARVGAGRIDARAATSTDVLAYTLGKNNPVSASFGVVAAPVDGGKVTRTKPIAVRNLLKKQVTVNLAYQPVISSPGVTYTVSPKRLTLGRNSAKRVTLTMTVDPTKLRHTIDPTMDKEQVNAFYGESEARQFVSDASGRLVVRPKGRAANRVPVYGAAKPTSHTSAALTGNAITLSGKGLATGDSSSDYNSLASVMQLGATSPRLPACTSAAQQDDGCATLASDKAGDIRYVGAGSTSAGDDSLLWFGMATYTDWATVGTALIPYVDYDVSGDGEADYETYVQTIDGTDLLYAFTVDLNDDGNLVDVEPVNFQTADVDTNVFDTNVVLMPVFKDAIGLPTTPGSAPISYVAGTFSASTGADLDSTREVSYDAGAPVIGTAEPLYEDLGGTSIPLTGSRATAATALVFHLHGARGSRAQVITVPAAPVD